MMPGLPTLRLAVAAHHAWFYRLEWDWQSEVVLIKPLQGSYLLIASRAGAISQKIMVRPA